MATRLERIFPCEVSKQLVIKMKNKQRMAGVNAPAAWRVSGFIPKKKEERPTEAMSFPKGYTVRAQGRPFRK